ncbi:MAG: helix-turn-helix domain-containing protein [Clostridia bacterium]|nr:helix-turn-helix domain-containing protein [Clostridia bacterium]
MNLTQINPFIRYANVHAFFKFSKKTSVCYDCRLFYIAQGEGVLTADGQNYSISGNEAVFLPALCKYRFTFKNNDATKIYILNLDLTDRFSEKKRSLGTATEDTFDPAKVLSYELPTEFSQPIFVKNGFAIHRHISKCVELFLQRPPYYAEEASARAKIALLEILREQINGEYPLVQSVIEYIRENYATAELSNQTIADHFHYHPYHLNRIMKASTKKTLHGYLLDYRIQTAKNLLVATALSVTMIAEKAGFSSYTYFIRLFRERTGQSPLQYRRTHERVGL